MLGNSSPYARKVRISLAEKGVPFELITEVPWDSTTKTPDYNPLEKLPVLIADDGEAVYESHFIMEWIEAHYGAPEYPSMYPSSPKDILLAKQVQVVADGICEAGVLLFFEKQREYSSKEWEARQSRKVDGGLRQLSQWVGEKDFIVGGKFGLADIAAGSALGWLNVRWPDQGWQEKYPNLKSYIDALEKRKSFKGSVPYAQKISDKIV